LPNSRLLIHQPMGMAQGQAVDVKIHAENLLEVRDQINRILAQHTGQPLERIEEDTDRDYFMTPEEAQEYGLLDEIIRPKKV
jgi:ATP-dependent Clp protease protease subunit